MFITFEGVEGTGKSTQVKLLAEYMSQLGYSVVSTREPGGTDIGECIRDVLLEPENDEMVSVAEIFLYLASRAQHVEELILPALGAGEVVICDRFSDATVAYQGYGRGFDLGSLESMNAIATGGLEPDLTILLDLNAETGLSRKGSEDLNRLDNEDIVFHRKVRQGYLAIARNSSGRVKIVKAAGTVEDIQHCIRKHVNKLLENRGMHC